MEVVLDRSVSEKRIFPAIDINKSGTRREDLLLSKKEQEAVYSIRKALSSKNQTDITEELLNLMIKTKSNNDLVDTINKNQI